MNKSKTTRIERKIEDAADRPSTSWGPVTTTDAPPARGATIKVYGRPYKVTPASIRNTRGIVNLTL
jgi:hypothetical protein